MPQKPNKSYSSKIIRLPYRGAPTTVGVIRDSVVEAQNHYIVRHLAEKIVGGVRARDYISESLAYYHWTCKYTRYMRDPRTVELVKAPWVVAEQALDGHVPSLDCDDMTAFLASMCAISGANVRAATVAFKHQFYRGQRQFSHIFCEVHEPRSKTWIALDPVAGKKTREMLRRAVAYHTWPLV